MVKKTIEKNQIKNIGGSVGYDQEGNTYTRDIVRINNKRVWSKWIMCNFLGCSGRGLDYFNKENKKYEEIQKRCAEQ